MSCEVCGKDHSQHSRQRKWQLHNATKHKEITNRYEKSEKGKLTRKLNRMRKSNER